MVSGFWIVGVFLDEIRSKYLTGVGAVYCSMLCLSVGFYALELGVSNLVLAQDFHSGRVSNFPFPVVSFCEGVKDSFSL